MSLFWLTFRFIIQSTYFTYKSELKKSQKQAENDTFSCLYLFARNGIIKMEVQYVRRKINSGYRTRRQISKS